MRVFLRPEEDMPLMLALMPVLVLLAFRGVCTLRPAPVPTYLGPRAQNG
jgi:hypothetical protein